MKVLKSSAPVPLNSLNLGDLFYVIGGTGLLLAMRIEEHDNQHPCLTYFEGNSPFELESAEHLLDALVVPALDLECRLSGPPKVAMSVQNVAPGSLVIGDGLSGIVVRNRKWKALFDLESGKGVPATSSSFAYYGAWKLVRVTEKPRDQVIEDEFTFPTPDSKDGP